MEIEFRLRHDGGASEQLFTRTYPNFPVPREKEHIHFEGEVYYIQWVEYTTRRRGADKVRVWLPCTSQREKVTETYEWGCTTDNNHPVRKMEKKAEEIRDRHVR